jgi:undecaprenyl-diphosphatase
LFLVSWWEAVILGLVQGLTEFLPISSSAHLRVFGALLPGGGDPGAAFTAITQIGTETAVILYFRRDLARILSAWWRSVTKRAPGDPLVSRTDPDARMGWFIALGSIPIVVLGLIGQDWIETTLRSLWFTGTTLIVFGLILGFADRRARNAKHLSELGPRDATLYGFAQAMALVPGVSRSGGTITAGLLMGYTREAAARYSFLLAIPAVLGSGFFQLFKSLDSFGTPGTPTFGATVLATLVAFAVGYVVIIGFLRLISEHSYVGFVWYRVVFGLVIILLLVTGAVPAVALP